MPSRKLLAEIKELLIKRGSLTKEQIAYARVEEKAIKEMNPMPKPHEERRYSQFRTLDRYIGEEAFQKIMEEKRRLALLDDAA